MENVASRRLVVSLALIVFLGMVIPASAMLEPVSPLPGAVVPAPIGSSAVAATTNQPNFVVIITDDQKWDTVGRCSPELDPFDFNAGTDACMPNLQNMLMQSGTTYLKGQVTQTLCCPSRASLLTGQYSTTHGVTNNNGTLFDDSSTLATWLDTAGYRTALFGKYLNGYGLGPLAGYKPPGWDVFESYHGYRNSDDPYVDYPWISFAEGASTGVISRINDADSTSGEACADGNLYSTDYICNITVDFLQADSSTPFLAYVNPATPHSPYTVADRHKGTFSGINIPHYPDTNVLPSPNPPSYLPTQALADRTLDRIEGTLRNVLAQTLSVDDMIGALHEQLTTDGRLDNTVWVFISDNGISSGEHHWRNKGCEYYVCHQVPFVVVCPTGICPGAQPGAVDADSYVLNVDIAPTIAALAGATPTIPVDGLSMVPILNDPGASWRSQWFMHGNDPWYEGIVGVGTDGDWYKYVEFPGSGEYEMYNLIDDPWELANLSGNGTHGDVESDLAARLDAHLNGDPPPNVLPTAMLSASCVDLSCDFADVSVDPDGTVVSWDWDFGDGSTSSLQDPSHSYADGGTYTVSLTVTDDDGGSDTVSTDVTVVDPTPNTAPTANFSSSCNNLDCDFTDTSTDGDGTVVSWDWDFGDGSTSTMQSPSHSYATGGTFTVSLTVTDDDGAADTLDVGVSVVEPPNAAPTAQFASLCDNLDCDFTDTSTDGDGTVVSWDWDFGDGSTSSLQDPSHSYAADGTYGVALTVTDDDGDSDTTVADVTVADLPNVAPTAQFASLCDNLDCDFTDTSTDGDGTVVSWDWDFGDGDTSTTQNPSHSYATGGTYTVSLTVTDDDGDSDTTVADVTVAANVAPTASFDSGCTDLDCDFTDTSTDGDGTVVSWDWDFGDGSTSTVQSPSHSYAAGGTYTVSLTVTDDDGVASDSISSDVTVVEPPNTAPTALFTSLCDNLDCDFTDTSTDGDGIVVSWDWDFGDGSTSTVQSPSHSYAAGGTYTVSLTVTDDDGESGTTMTDVVATDPVGGGPFLESDGLVVMEAENYHATVERSGDSWLESIDPTGFSGDAAMASGPDDGTRVRTDVANIAPEMSFDVEFTTTGTYYIWLRAWAPDIRGKAMFAGLDGVIANDGIAAGGSGSWGDGVGEWTWSNTGKRATPVFVDVTTPGVHTIQVWMGDDGVIVDKVILSTDPLFVPVDLGPPESEQGSAPVAEIAYRMI